MVSILKICTVLLYIGFVSTTTTVPVPQPLPSPVPVPVPSPVPLPVPAPVPAPILPTYCLRQYSDTGCNGTLLQEVTLVITGCTNFTLVGSNLTKSIYTGSQATTYSVQNCSASPIVNLNYQSCSIFSSPFGSVFINLLPCTQPNQYPPTPTPVTTIPVTTSPQTNCVYLYTQAICGGSSTYWGTIPCGPLCTQILPTIYASSDCLTNQTALYSDSFCINYMNSVSQSLCGGFSLNSGYRSYRTKYNEACPALPTSPPPSPTPTPTPTPAGMWCKRTYSSPGCSAGFLNQSTGVCQSCDSSVYKTDCAANTVTRFTLLPCTGSVLITFAFGSCYNSGGNSLSYSYGACGSIIPVPAPAPAPSLCATFWKASTCTSITTVTESSPGTCFNQTIPSLGASFFSASSYKSFVFNCNTGLARLYSGTACSGGSTSLSFGSPACVSWNPIYNLLVSTNNLTCSTCPTPSPAACPVVYFDSGCSTPVQGSSSAHCYNTSQIGGILAPSGYVSFRITCPSALITLYTNDGCTGPSSNLFATTTSPACNQIFSSSIPVPVYTTLDICADPCGTHAPVPVPSPQPAPQPNPSPIPVPVPVPAPFGTPVPLPSPKPAPIPLPSPNPLPSPIPSPVPVPVPIPAPVPPPSNSSSSSEDPILDNLAISAVIVSSIFVLLWFLFFILFAVARRRPNSDLEFAVPVYKEGHFTEQKIPVTMQTIRYHRSLLIIEAQKAFHEALGNLRKRGQN